MTSASLTDRVESLDWDELARPARRTRLRRHGAGAGRGRVRRLAELFDGGSFRSTIDMARHRFGDGRYRYFDHPLPEEIARAARRLLRAAGADRQRLVGAARRRTDASRSTHERAARPLPRGRPGAAHAADPALRRGRLERPAPGPLRRRVLPVPGRDGAVGAGRRLRGRRVRPGRAAPARPEPCPRARPAAGRVRDLPHPGAAAARASAATTGSACATASAP